MSQRRANEWRHHLHKVTTSTFRSSPRPRKRRFCSPKHPFLQAARFLRLLQHLPLLGAFSLPGSLAPSTEFGSLYSGLGGWYARHIEEHKV